MNISFDSENELESHIFNAYQKTGINPIDHTQPDRLIRQLRIGGYGIADLVGFSLSPMWTDGSQDLIVYVYEVKKELITARAFEQVCRYATGLEIALNSELPETNVTIYPNVVGVSIDDSAAMLDYIGVDFIQARFCPDNGVVFCDPDSLWTPKGDGDLSPVSAVISGLRKEKSKNRPFDVVKNSVN